jgi:hypothetical protein
VSQLRRLQVKLMFLGFVLLNKTAWCTALDDSVHLMNDGTLQHSNSIPLLLLLLPHA